MATLKENPIWLAAKAAGDLTFDLGIPCKSQGHVSPRYTSTGNCMACNIARNAARCRAKSGRKRMRGAPVPVVSLFTLSERKARALFGGLHHSEDTHAARVRSDYLDRVLREKTDRIKTYPNDKPKPPPPRIYSAFGQGARHHFKGVS